ncbi:hypothetical protein DY000_02003917 [Brassica cretica]|uniref:Secreted protein n=1 Tax=Brassica cretica TaxID=69181 RepID=A0ABQ7C959_BRACR|nr:hypothetical protein DY000_02003917 [Brassica cretica]
MLTLCVLFLLRNRWPQPSFAFFVGLSCHRIHLLRRKFASPVYAMKPLCISRLEITVGRLCPLRCSNHPSRPLQLSSKPRPHMTKLPRRRCLAYRDQASSMASRSISSTLLHHGISRPSRLLRGRA